jgi:hypothetical protein
VAVVDFVPLTVAGQRWNRTIFPDHRLKLRYNLAFIHMLLFNHLMVMSSRLSSLIFCMMHMLRPNALLELLEITCYDTGSWSPYTRHLDP